MIPVETALERLTALADALDIEDVPLDQAAGRVLARDVAARRDQPPFAASAMDGYAVNAAEAERDAQFRVIGEAAAGHRFDGRVGAGQCVRIFTGAPLPEGTDFVIIQEDVHRTGQMITVTHDPGTAPHVRARGADFSAGATVSAPRLLRPQDIALLAAMNVPAVPVTRRPRVAILSTGDELVMPGETPGPDQIIVSNSFGLQAMLRDHGATAEVLPIARDTVASLQTAFAAARDADLILTIGGASVGDHDLVGQVAGELGMEQAFYKIAMRPGKPLMAGRMGGSVMIGLPGNPVSAMVCGHVFVLPVIRRMQGLEARAPDLMRAPLAAALQANGPRAHYMRATLHDGTIRAFDRQDSALLGVLAAANALLVRPPHDPARAVGETVGYMPL
ncbi:MAG: molybdopterin molybdotransferase MoeA [Rhodobacteraceae bacterium]|nr:molybdopterin molybdotransferase MoeA [Paracoccaceae bacterium]